MFSSVCRVWEGTMREAVNICNSVYQGRCKCPLFSFFAIKQTQRNCKNAQFSACVLPQKHTHKVHRARTMEEFRSGGLLHTEI